jgi:hypothetical protein
VSIVGNNEMLHALSVDSKVKSTIPAKLLRDSERDVHDRRSGGETSFP